jgi:glucose/arabinose dehydrogenase
MKNAVKMLLAAGTVLVVSAMIKAEIDSPADDLVLPPGFKSSVIINELGKNRHIAVNDNGDIYVRLDSLKDGKGIYVLRDENKDGKYIIANSFGDYKGTGIAIGGGFLYASSDEDIYRYKLVNNQVSNTTPPEKIVSGLLNLGKHESKSITIDKAGNLYVNVGAPSNACQGDDRTPGSPGLNPCPLLDKAGGIWQFKTNIANQTYAEGLKYATGLRNVVGLDWNKENNSLYVVQHGRDQLNFLYPGKFNDQQNAELPAEEMFMIKKGSDAGWPYCYYDGRQKKKVMSPEYGGDGKKQGNCPDKEQPIMAFPAHWAPNALLFYTGTMFPEKYRNGAFIAFHGSWNRSPFEQGGYNVVFVPFKNGKPSGNYEVFANGFAGKNPVSDSKFARFRPCGLAQGPDGSLYISDSKVGRIWRITY